MGRLCGALINDIQNGLASLSPRRMRAPRVYLPLSLIVVALFLPHLVRSVYLTHVLIMILLFAALGEAWNLLGGYGGQLSLGHSAYFGLGAYTSTILLNYWNLSPWAGMVIGGVLAMLLGTMLGAICYRLGGAYFAIATIGLAEIMRLLALHFTSLTKGAVGMTIPFIGDAPLYFQFRSKVPYYYIALALLLGLIYLTSCVERSRLGYYLRAVGLNQDAAEAIGINSTSVKGVANQLSAFTTAICGTFYAQYLYFIDPDSVFGINTSIHIALVAIVGGVGTVWGPVLGAAIIESLISVTQLTLAGTIFGLEQIVYGGLLVGIILWKPSGVVVWLGQQYRAICRYLPGSAERYCR